MKKIFLFLLTGALLTGCSSLSFYLPSPVTDWEAYPVSQSDGSVAVGGYQLFQDGSYIRDITGFLTFNNQRNYEKVRTYSFYEKGKLKDRVRIIQKFDQSGDSKNLTTIWKDMDIEVTDLAQGRYRFSVDDQMTGDDFITFQLPTLVIATKVFDALNDKNQIQHFWGFPTGLKFNVAGKDFARLSFLGDNTLYVNKASGLKLTPDSALAILVSLEVHLKKNNP
ncbi:MAG: membrane lipoprotein lipid attachment site-containing protein [Spirochaetales bacterium]|nr:membrane lipoprotein lipid attachment site-containing protein [Spirochaetales bacterium]